MRILLSITLLLISSCSTIELDVDDWTCTQSYNTEYPVIQFIGNVYRQCFRCKGYVHILEYGKEWLDILPFTDSTTVYFDMPFSKEQKETIGKLSENVKRYDSVPNETLIGYNG